MEVHLERLAFNIRWRPRKISIQKFLTRYSKYRNNIFFIQIGSNDGVTRDPLHRHIIKDKWKGIVVEPVKYIYERLVRNYEGHENVTCKNVAIADENETRKFYRLRENNDGLPIWYDQIGSLDLNVVLAHQHKIENFYSYLMTDLVECITFESLVQNEHVEKVDLVHIDAEGYDFEILKMLDMKRYKPEVILFEHKHLDLPTYKQAILYLKKNHYRLYREKNDTLAILRL